MITLALVVFAAVALVTLLLTMRGAVPTSESIDELQSRLVEVDLPAFLNLTSPDEVAFLQRTLPPQAFRRMHRLRVRVALKYLSALAHNARVLVRIGELASRNPDECVSQAGRALANRALRTRLLVFRASSHLIREFIFPKVTGSSVNEVLRGYSELDRRFALLTAARRPLLLRTS